MADAYGTLIFTKSEDCTYDAERLLDALNLYKWSYCGGKWILKEGNTKPCFDTYSPQYPTVYVEKFERYLIEKNSEEIWVTAVDLTDEDQDDIQDVQLSTPSLDEVCRDLSCSIQSGWFEIGLSANMNLRYAYFQKLQVFADGRGVRHYCMTGYGYPEGISTDFTSNWTIAT